MAANIPQFPNGQMAMLQQQQQQVQQQQQAQQQAIAANQQQYVNVFILNNLRGSGTNLPPGTWHAQIPPQQLLSERFQKTHILYAYCILLPYVLARGTNAR